MRVKQLFILALLISSLCACAAATERYRLSQPLGPGPFSELMLELQSDPAAKGMVLAAQDRTNALVDNETSWSAVDFSFSLFGNPIASETNGTTPGEHSGDSDLVSRYFHMAQGFFSSGSMTRFAVGNRNERTDLSLQTLRRDGLWGVERVRFVNSDGDWFSQLWRDQGRTVPEQWIAKRYTFTLVNRTDRFVYEYREPYPDCLPPANDSGRRMAGMLYGEAQNCLAEFSRRADAFVEAIPTSAESGATEISTIPLNAMANATAATAVPVPPATPPGADVFVDAAQSIEADSLPRRRVLLNPVSILGDVERIERDDAFR